MTQQLKPGLIGFTHGYTLLSKSIQFFGWLYLNLWDRKHRKEPIFNHVIMTFEYFGQLYIVEANSKATVKGWKNCVKVTKYIYSEYYLRSIKVAWKEPIVPWTKDELKTIEKLALHFEGRKYGKSDIGFHVFKTFTNTWFGATGEKAQKGIICCELAETICNANRPTMFKSPWSDNVMDTWNNDEIKHYIV